MLSDVGFAETSEISNVEICMNGHILTQGMLATATDVSKVMTCGHMPGERE